MITNAELVPLIDEEGVNTDFLAFGTPPNGECLIQYEPDSTFRYICSSDCNIEEYCEQYGWFIISSCLFNENTSIGVGFSDIESVTGRFYQVSDSDKLKLWSDILSFAFSPAYKELFIPYDNRLKGAFRIDGAACYYIHDYTPVNRSGVKNVEQKKILNLLFRFKQGQHIALIAKMFSLAVCRLHTIDRNRDNMILIPIAASTTQRHRSRFFDLCRILSKRIGIDNGYDAVSIIYDREEYKGLFRTDKIEHIRIDKGRVTGKHILLIDDVTTTGESFAQMREELRRKGALSVTGIFLAKTTS